MKQNKEPTIAQPTQAMRQPRLSPPMSAYNRHEDPLTLPAVTRQDNEKENINDEIRCF